MFSQGLLFKISSSAKTNFYGIEKDVSFVGFYRFKNRTLSKISDSARYDENISKETSKVLVSSFFFGACYFWAPYSSTLFHSLQKLSNARTSISKLSFILAKFYFRQRYSSLISVAAKYVSRSKCRFK